MLRCVARIVVFGIICCVLVLLIQFWLKTKTYTFSESVIASIADKNAVQNNRPTDPSTLFRKVYKELMLLYPGRLLPERDLQWLFMNAGGWMGSICILHASVTEYVLFFGTALDTSGHSGRYWANISDTVLTGEFHQWLEGEFVAKIHKPGTTVKHVAGEVTAVHFKGGTWAVEYGRGFIPSTLGFALADTIFSTQDFITLFHILRVYAKALALEVGYYIAHPQEMFSY